MTEAEVAEMFIRVAQTDQKLPRSGEKPKAYGSYALPYVHSQADMNGWGSRPGERDQLKPEDREQHAAHRASFWEGRNARATTAEVTEWQAAITLVGTLKNESQRRALWAWAFSKVGLGSFKDWCFNKEGIHPETGRRRKDRAISLISRSLAGRTVLPDDLQAQGVLAEPPENAYLEHTFEDGAQKRATDNSWRSDPSLKPIFDSTIRDTSWADRRNERRRRMEKDRAA
ncbi:hypothetical protein LA66_06930 [Aureimonas altamirensis]|uniref:Uncharacterized protein n=1 Tax=Aureimonas altamirensis TaxID=370622 RepID=A0A0B1QA88_9HYPH|nr:hypothetical protein [Aureimonas altamirensis]KHJ56291.1 hypothetical protein LA66_06930 [Aureimonas altamirensis]